MKAVRVSCRHCRRKFTKSMVEQKYCGRAICQSARKRAWSRAKYASDPDYRLNQKESTDAWLESQGGAAEYYREYRRRRSRRPVREGPGAVVAAGAESTPREESKGSENSSFVQGESPIARLFAQDDVLGDASANRDVSVQYSPIKTGIYEVFSAGANRDAVLVEIRMISS